MYDQGDQEDRDIAAEQTKDAQLREEMPDDEERAAPSPSNAGFPAGQPSR